MIKSIDKKSKILYTQEFENDKYLFSILFQNILNSSTKVYSDEKNYIFCQGEKNKPIWIWTKDNFNLNVLSEIEHLISNHLTDSSQMKFTCKPKLHQLLMKENYRYLNEQDYKEIGFLTCENVKKNKACDGFIYIPNMYDIDLLSRYYYENSLETKGINAITYEQARIYIENQLKNGNIYSNSDNTIYCWKNEDNKIVSLATYSSNENYAKINNVFTPPEERRKGYASNLIYCITKEILNDQSKPIVYLSNNSNCNYNLYTNIGYVKSGSLINFTCSKVKIKRK